MRTDDPPYSHPVAVATLHGETRIKLTPDAETLRRIAKAMGLDAVTALEADFQVSHAANGLVTIRGDVSAAIRPICVVTLEAFDDRVREPVEITFAPLSLIEKMIKRAEENEDTEFEPPDEIINGMIDFGELATEFLALGLDPYPRKPGAEFAAGIPEPERESPFSALKNLKLKGQDE